MPMDKPATADEIELAIKTAAFNVNYGGTVGLLSRALLTMGVGLEEARKRLEHWREEVGKKETRIVTLNAEVLKLDRFIGDKLQSTVQLNARLTAELIQTQKALQETQAALRAARKGVQ